MMLAQKKYVRNFVILGLLPLLIPLFFLFGLNEKISSDLQHLFNIEVGENKKISLDLADRPLTEPHIVVNPDNPAHILGSVIVSVSDEVSSNKQTSVVFVTFDGGQNWERHDFALTSSFDPWVELGSGGTALFSVLGKAKNMKNRELLIYRSEDGGKTWNQNPVKLGRGHDHETMTVDRSGGKFDGKLYLASILSGRNADGNRRSAVYVASSGDDGISFEEKVRKIPSNLNMNTMNPVVMSTGKVVVPYMDFMAYGKQGFLENRRGWVITSDDGGETFSEPLFVSEEFGAGSGFPSLAIDRSGGEFNDRLYYLSSKGGLNRHLGVNLFYSDDAGESWNGPIRVDHFQGNDPYLRTPVMAVNKDGVIGVAWYDRRNDPDRENQDIYFTVSHDGGVTFKQEIRVTEVSSSPYTELNGDAGDRWPSGGEYFGLAAKGDGSFILVWPDSREGIYQLYSSVIEINKQ